MFDLHASDLPELERLAANGYEWIARDWNEQVYAYTAKPFKYTTTWVGGFKCEKIIGLGINSQIGVRWSDPEPLNIAAAIAQIKAQKKPSGCKFCRGEVYLPQSEYDFIEENGKHYIVFEGVWMEIFYCPMCGTPLNQTEQKAEATDD